MQNKGIIIFLILLGVVIIGLIAGDFLSGRPDRSKPNPFAYNIDEFREVDPSLIHYKETKVFRIGLTEPSAMTVNNDIIYVAGDKKLLIIDLSGNLTGSVDLPGTPRAVEVSGKKFFLAVENRVWVVDNEGNVLKEWPSAGGNTVITAIAAGADQVFVADAGNRRILRYSNEGELLGTFDGKTKGEDSFGFVIPSPFFDLDINSDGELWVINPGLHALENYTYKGEFRTFWENTGMKTEGFSGCCNPAYFTFLTDGRFVTSEKGLVRVKIYKRSGEFEGVVAAPTRFDGEKAPDITTDSQDRIYLLDFDKKQIRVFEPKK